ncbi:hypothetical protein [Virgibacillus pantothenticus]|uniref:hypothetical protein n=1 Tax=Virgibacillus pantothenticus TaxID=1473 RepID=UPI00098797C4|nr:hypothetical protein [Virgibacillus pantothenticus]
MRKGIIVLVSLISIIVLAIFLLIKSSPEKQAEEAAEEFFTYEQEGAFANSWDMFHPFIKNKFTKETYIQDRSEAMMTFFGELDFTYSFGDVEKITDWSPGKDEDPIPTAYRITVSQQFAGKYGNSSLVQDIYLVNIEGEWKILWDYKNGDEDS